MPRKNRNRRDEGFSELQLKKIRREIKKIQEERKNEAKD